MSRKQYSKELKLELVKKHLEDGISYWKLGKQCLCFLFFKLPTLLSVISSVFLSLPAFPSPQETF